MYVWKGRGDKRPVLYTNSWILCHRLLSTKQRQRTTTQAKRFAEPPGRSAHAPHDKKKPTITVWSLNAAACCRLNTHRGVGDNARLGNRFAILHPSVFMPMTGVSRNSFTTLTNCLFSAEPCGLYTRAVANPVHDAGEETAHSRRNRHLAGIERSMEHRIYATERRACSIFGSCQGGGLLSRGS